METVGLLCSPKTERIYALRLSRLLTKRENDAGEAFLLFSLSNLSLIDRTVYGTRVTAGAVEAVHAGLPHVVYNLAVQHQWKDIRKFRGMMELEGVATVNSANRYNQRADMEILSSCDETRGYVLPFESYGGADLTYDFKKAGRFILRPESGDDSARVIYGCRAQAGFDLYNWAGNRFSHLFDLSEALRPTVRSGSWLLLRTPELAVSRSRLLMTRAFLQRGKGGEWCVLGQTGAAQNSGVIRHPDEKAASTLLRLVGRIGCFIPDLGVCHIDLVYGVGGEPYFLGLGGWHRLLLGCRTDGLRRTVCENLLGYAGCLQDRLSE